MKRFHPLLTTAILFIVPVPADAQVLSVGLVELAPPTDQAKPRILGFERQQFTVQRVRGKVFIDSVESADDIVERETQEVRLVEAFDELDFADTREFRAWAKTLRGARTYTYDNVFLEQPDGSVVTIPLVLLPPGQRAIADVQWRVWLDRQQALVAEKQRDEERRKAEQNRIRQLDALVQQQTANAERLANLESRIARNARRQAYFARQIVVGSTGTALGFGGNGVQFLSTSATSPIQGFLVPGAAFGGNP